MQVLLEKRDAKLWYVIDREKVKKLLSDEQPWPWYGQLMTGPQTVAYFLQLEYWLEHYKIKLI